MKKLTIIVIILLCCISGRAEDALYSEKWMPVLEKYIGGTGLAGKWAEKILPDGSWKDVKYEDDDNTTVWDPSSHCTRFQKMALLYHKTGDERVLEACHKAMNYWFDLHCNKREQLGYDKAWYYRMLYVPRAMGPGFVLLRDKMTPEEIEGATQVMKEAYGHPNATGFNRVDLAGARVFLGVMLKDTSIINEAVRAIGSVLETTTEEGIQPDMSFHQHGAMLQIGTYGMGFVESLCWWYAALKETPWALPAERSNILTSYINDGIRWFSYKGYFDMSGLARQIQKGTQASRAQQVDKLLERTGLDKQPEPKGAKYFPYSDYGIYRNDNFYASVRMQSNRVKGFEYINNMNKQGWFSSDGALLIRRTGDEYDDIPPLWNWHRVPGTTAWDDDTDLTLYRRTFVRPVPVRFNLTDKVFGKADGDYMVAAMELSRDSVYARKAWFFCPEGILCLGAGITSKHPGQIVTTVNQCIAKDDFISGSNWVFQDGITYVFLEKSKYKATSGQRSGNWKTILDKASGSTVKGNVFELVINHGNNPENASYAYFIAPCGMAPGKVTKAVKASVKVISNTPDYQKVQLFGRTLSVNWDGCEILSK